MHTFEQPLITKRPFLYGSHTKSLTSLPSHRPSGYCPCQNRPVHVYIDTSMSIEKVSFGTTKIQKLRRVALDAHLLETLNLREGDAVQVELDVATATIVMRKAVNAQVKVPRTTSRRRGA